MARTDEPWTQLATRIPKELHRRLKLHCVTHEIAVQSTMPEVPDATAPVNEPRWAVDNDGGHRTDLTGNRTTRVFPCPRGQNLGHLPRVLELGITSARRIADGIHAPAAKRASGPC